MSHSTPRRPPGALAIAAVVATAVAITAAPIPSQAEPPRLDVGVEVVRGTLPDGSPFEIRMPGTWNGTLAVYSHGLLFPGQAEELSSAIDPAVGGFLLDHGTALAGAAFGTGWAVEHARRDARATVREVTSRFGRPDQVVAYGDSLGGLVSTALVERRPRLFDGALSLCGVQAGAVPSWNHFLDSAFVIKTLLPNTSGLRLTGISDPLGNLGVAAGVLAAADGMASGRARLALAAAVAQLPGAVDADGPVSAPTVEGRYDARRAWLDAPYLPLVFAERSEMEARVGGNPSWNTGVDYRQVLRLSGQRRDVQAMYRRAGLRLNGDLRRLAAAPRVAADRAAVGRLDVGGRLSGELEGPVLTLRNVADGALPSAHDRAYRHLVRRAGRTDMLRQAHVGRPGHCVFTPAETITALRTLIARVRTGSWGSTTPVALNDAALALGPGLNQGGGSPVPPAFVRHHPRRFPR